jgi:ribulose-phosphate 3-epimerase
VAFHIESLEDVRENISLLRSRGKKVGLALLHSTPADHLDQYLLEIDYVLIMTIKGGFSGTPFIPEVLKKIQEIHQKKPELPVLVDGGINLETAQLCANQ